ncbi:MAG: hypothetical protein MI861_11865, partial [Pirellulales bacterium]|nr:hypothetical protein [Pirellulales bacterium]
PLAAAALYLTRQSDPSGDTVLIDLLSDDAEIVVARDGHVIFVRTVRMPSAAAARPKALAGELRRSLVACGSSGSLNRVVLWGLESVHQDDVAMLSEASGSNVEVLDPFQLVDVDRKIRGGLPEHVGRLAPLVGLIASDESYPDRLIDFLNPRQRVEETPNPWKKAAMIATPVAAVLLLAFLGYRHLAGLDTRIAELKKANAAMQPDVDAALDQINETSEIDRFLDANVNWLNELRRMAVSMPPSDRMIVRSISATGDPRNGGGTLSVVGAVTDTEVIDRFENAMRDEAHRVMGDGSTYQDVKDAYKWTAVEAITVSGSSIQAARYEGLAPRDEEEEETAADKPPPTEQVQDQVQEEVASGQQETPSKSSDSPQDSNSSPDKPAEPNSQDEPSPAENEAPQPNQDADFVDEAGDSLPTTENQPNADLKSEVKS